MKVTVNVDGACEPVNPGGISSYGFVVKDSSGKTLKEGKGVVGEGEGMTNNVAEYTAAIEGLKWVADNLDPSKVTLQSDSQLIIKHVTGKYAVRSPRLYPLYEDLKNVINSLYAGFEAEWVPRKQNERADALSKTAVREYVRTHDYRFNGYHLVECDECGAWMVVRDGKHGKFYGCSRYPKCEKTKSLKESEGDTEQ